MAEQEITPGVIMHLNDQLVEVVRSAGPSEVLVKKISDGKQLIVSLGSLLAIPTHKKNGGEPTNKEHVVECGHITEDTLKKAKIIFDVLADLHKLPTVGKKAIDDAKKLLGISQASIYRKLSGFDPEQGLLGVLGSKRGRKFGSRILDNAIEATISRAIEIAYRGKAANYSHVYVLAKAYCIRLGLTPPSLTAVRARVNAIQPRERVRRVDGSEAARQKYQPRPGKKRTRMPLEIVQIDHTLVDAIICDEETRQPLCRPWLTIVIDLFTRAILGFHISISAPSRKTIAMALTHAVFPKDHWIKSIGAEGISYPMYGKPKLIMVDNAKEFRSSSFSSACLIHDINLRWRPFGGKHFGGHVERAIGTFMGKVHFLPGTTMSNPVKKGGYDSEKNSAMTLREFVLWFTREVSIYHETVHRKLEDTPLSIWNRSFSKSNGEYVFPPMQTDPYRFRIDFLPSEKRSIQNTGISLYGNSYWDPVLKFHVGKKDVIVKFDPDSMRKIWAFIDGDYIEVGYADSTLPDVTLSELKLAKYAQREKVGDYNNLNPILLAEENRTLVERAIRKTKKQRKSIEKKRTANLFEVKAMNPEPSYNKDRPDYSKKPLRYNVED